MSLNLDPRQRAMLEAMHIKLWQPEPVVLVPDVPVATKNVAARARTADAEAGFDAKK